MLRRRIVDNNPEFIINSINNPGIVAAMYNAGWCKSPNGMTIREAINIKDSDLESYSPFANTNKVFNEDFSAFKYFTNVTTLHNTSFINTGVSNIILPPTITTIYPYAFRSSVVQCIQINSKLTVYGSINYGSFVTNRIYVCTSKFPPTNNAGTADTFGGDWGGRLSFLVYVPDMYYDDYITYFSSLKTSTGAGSSMTAQELVDRVKVLSEYDWHFGDKSYYDKLN